MNNIYLVGFMGTGKTTVGKALAAKLKRQFVDLDELIELRQKMAISDIFSRFGEEYFRKAEKKMLKEVSSVDDFIVACGGGIVLDKENIRLMKDTGKLICLSATSDAILKRTSGFGHRPLLNVASPRKQIELLLKMRSPYYALADRIIDTSRLTVEKVVSLILKSKAANTVNKKTKNPKR